MAGLIRTTKWISLERLIADLPVAVSIGRKGRKPTSFLCKTSHETALSGHWIKNVKPATENAGAGGEDVIQAVPLLGDPALELKRWLP